MKKPIKPTEKHYKNKEDYEEALDYYYHQCERYHKYIEDTNKEVYRRAKEFGVE